VERTIVLERTRRRREEQRRRRLRTARWGLTVAAVAVLAVGALVVRWLSGPGEVQLAQALPSPEPASGVAWGPASPSAGLAPGASPSGSSSAGSTASRRAFGVGSAAAGTGADGATSTWVARSGGSTTPVQTQEAYGSRTPVSGISSGVRIPARGYYVSCTGGDDSGDGSSSRPWRSLRRVQSHVFAADTGLYLQRGCTWNEQLEIRGAGSASAPVLVAGYGSGSRPVIRSAGSPGNSSIALLGDYMQLADIVISGAPGYGVQLFGEHAYVVGVRVQNSGAGIRVIGAHSVIDHVTVTDLHMVVNTSAPNDDYGAVGFIIEASDAEIRYSSCTGCRAPSSDYGYDGGFVEIWNHGDRLSVHDNTASNTQGFLEVGGNVGDASARSVVMTRNTLVETHGGLFIHTDGPFGIDVSGIVFSQNKVTNRSRGTNPVFGGDLSPLTIDGNTVIANQPMAFEAPGRHLNNRFYADNLGFSPSSSETRSSYASAP